MSSLKKNLYQIPDFLKKIFKDYVLIKFLNFIFGFLDWLNIKYFLNYFLFIKNLILNNNYIIKNKN